ncbi:hypothetical protein FB451DRAFT_1359248 [Mycena latifolia]|nr:hypothetical protein FB451DRAFT_1359248 [Mycena latifolia]
MRLSTVGLIAVLLAPFTLAVPVADADTVLTPGGPCLRKNIKEVPAGAIIRPVGTDIHVFDASGILVHVATPGPAFTPRSPPEPAPVGDGWKTYAYWDGGAWIDSLSATWTVPPAPATYHGQLIYLFIGLDNTDAASNAIAQAVLQYGVSPAGGGAFWAVASWYILADQVFYTTPVPVSVGQQVTGFVDLTGAGGWGVGYTIQFNVPNTRLLGVAGPGLFHATVTLEAYNTTAKSDYPTGSTVFTGTNLSAELGGTPYAVAWSTVNDTTDGLSTTVNVNGASGAQIEIHYGH